MISQSLNENMGRLTAMVWRKIEVTIRQCQHHLSNGMQGCSALLTFLSIGGVDSSQLRPGVLKLRIYFILVAVDFIWQR